MNAPQTSGAHAQSHITPLNTYLAVGASLLFLTAVTVWVARFDFGSWNMIVAMVVATIKASLVVLFFMHLLHDNKFFGAILLISLIALTVFIVFTMLDNGSRASINTIQMEEINKKAKIYDGKPATETAPAAAQPKH